MLHAHSSLSLSRNWTLSPSRSSYYPISVEITMIDIEWTMMKWTRDAGGPRTGLTMRGPLEPFHNGPRQSGAHVLPGPRLPAMAIYVWIKWFHATGRRGPPLAHPWTTRGPGTIHVWAWPTHTKCLHRWENIRRTICPENWPRCPSQDKSSFINQYK